MQELNKFHSKGRRFSIIDMLKKTKPAFKILSKYKTPDKNLVDFYIEIAKKIDEMSKNVSVERKFEPTIEEQQVYTTIVEQRDPLNKALELTEFQPHIRLPEVEMVNKNVKATSIDLFGNKEDKLFTSFLIKEEATNSKKEEKAVNKSILNLKEELEKTKIKLEEKKKELNEIERIAREKRKELRLKAKERKLKEKKERKRKKELERQKKLETKKLLKEKKLAEKKKEENILEQKPVETSLEEELRQALAIIDRLLENLPDETIDKFVQSEDFKIYEKVMNRYLKRE